MNKPKKIFVFVFLLCFSIGTQAQFTLSTLYTGWFLPSNDSLPRMDRMIFTLNWETLSPSSVNGVKLSPFSNGASITRVFDIPFSKHAGIGFGPGITWHNLHNNGEFIYNVLPDNSDSTIWQPFPGEREYKTNKLTLIYVDAVFQFRLRFGKLYGFRFYPGFKAGYLISDYRKYKDENSKVKIYNIHNLMAYRYGPTIHISIGNFALTGFYSLTGLFEKNKGTQSKIMSIGLSYLFI
jgi:hypothetical protein